YKILRNALLRGIKELKFKLRISKPRFTTIVGNPVMLSFYLGESVKNFGHYPFEGHLKNGIYTKNPPGYVFGCIGGFVGGDTIAGIIASGLLQMKKPSLYIDLGTNGEIALITDEKIYAVSTAAGPAFEGVGLSCGSLACPGAIERVKYRSNFKIFTIENKPPVGFCASGFIDLLATLLKLELLTEYGMLKKEIRIAGFKITQMDIRTLQLAIGAIHTGIKYLLDYIRIKPSRVNAVVITGEFGSHLNIDSVKRIGLIPTGVKDVRTESDLALSGAVQLLLNKITVEYTEEVRKKSVHLELATQEDFQKRFVDGLILKPWN
ncbi:MAG: ASKHA domain-containing protein, partial [candidate division WOR-3 bacterium]